MPSTLGRAVYARPCRLRSAVQDGVRVEQAGSGGAAGAVQPRVSQPRAGARPHQARLQQLRALSCSLGKAAGGTEVWCVFSIEDGRAKHEIWKVLCQKGVISCTPLSMFVERPCSRRPFPAERQLRDTTPRFLGRALSWPALQARNDGRRHTFGVVHLKFSRTCEKYTRMQAPHGA